MSTLESQTDLIQRLQEAVMLSSWQLSPSTSPASSVASSNRSSTCSVHEAAHNHHSDPVASCASSHDSHEHESIPTKAERTLNRRGSIRRKVKQMRSRSEHRSRSTRAAHQQVDDGATPRFLRIEQLLDTPTSSHTSSSVYTLLEHGPDIGGSQC
eukprot:m.4247 g.4247  ORF g.4247 m.4247 type:complete len:155 (-) comp6797_c0_seq1:154-618(-)